MEHIKASSIDCKVIKLGQLVTLTYKNYKGKVEERNIIPVELRYGVTEHHTEEQWFLHAYDTDKGAYRTFALKDFQM